MTHLKRARSKASVVRTVWLLFAGVLPVFVGVASAARMPDRVTKSFLITGARAITVAELLGLPSDVNGEYRLPWMKDRSECYKGTEDGQARYGPCSDTPTPVNIVRFIAGGDPRLELSGTWLDGETGSLPDMPRYTFRSPPVAPLPPDEKLEAWSFVRDRFERGKARGVGDDASTPREYREQALANEQPLVEVAEIHQGNQLSYVLRIDDRPPAERELVRRRYEECLERMRGLDGGC